MKKEDFTSLLWTLVLIGFIRAFIVEPFKIPSGSMIPTLLIGDHLFVAKSSYDIGIPFTNIKLLRVADPDRGDVVVFEYPNYEQDPSKDGYYYIKRVIGTPGDKVALREGVIYINGERVEQMPYPGGGPEPGEIPGYRVANANDVYLEKLPGQEEAHLVQRNRDVVENFGEFFREYQAQGGEGCLELAYSLHHPYAQLERLVSMNQICEFTVPEDKYFVMGDNREDSADGREWGFATRDSLKGQALFIWLSLHSDKGYENMPAEGPLGSVFRWSRFGLTIN